MYFEISDNEAKKAKEVLRNEGIIILSEFESLYDEVWRKHVSDYVDNIVSEGGGYLSDKECERMIMDMTLDDRLILKATAQEEMERNEDLTETIEEATIDAIENTLRNLFVRK